MDKLVESIIMSRIRMGLFAAIRFTNHNSILQYLYNLHIHYNLDGEPTLNIGNASGIQGEFTLISITVEGSCKYFGTILFKNRSPKDLLAGPEALTMDPFGRHSLEQV